MMEYILGRALWFSKRRSIVSLLVGLLVLSCGQGVYADTYTVTNTNISGVGSLWQAITDANSHPGADTIQFMAGLGSIDLVTAGLPVISDDLTIAGPSANRLTVGRLFFLGWRYNVFQIKSTTGKVPNVTISGLAIIGVSETGGVIDNVNGNVTVRNCSLFGQSLDLGSGVSNAATMALEGCTITGRTDLRGSGGGAYNTGTMTMTNCTLSGSVVAAQSDRSQHVFSRGAGIYNAGSLHVSHCTLADNQTVESDSFGSPQYPGQGGGIYNTGTLTIDNTIIKDGTLQAGVTNGGGSLVNAGGKVISKGYNLTNDRASGQLVASGDQINTDPLLSPQLVNNGGPIQTRLPLPGSPAINAGDPAFTSPPATDQRGLPRISGKRTDIGAVEIRLPLDFGDDGHNALLFQNKQTGQIAFWSLNGLSVTGGSLLSNAPLPGWKLVGSGDFNHDYWPDLVFQNTSTKQIVIWFMQAGQYIGGVTVSRPSSEFTTYPAVGVGDFNGDGQADIAFEDNEFHHIVLWYFTPSVTTALVASTATSDRMFQPEYRAVAVGDFNRSGTADVLFQNMNTGQLAVWYMRSNIVLNGAILSAIPTPGWQIRTAADYNNDGWPDLVFQNTTNSRVAVWFLNGLSFTGGGPTSIQPLAPYQIAAPH